ncbi:threonine--tRNA ligase [Candidatus Parcubacteria bacterium]|nr:MAG: threonine--tRNA ligase [Candidatus Parcubacteria bacterium]
MTTEQLHKIRHSLSHLLAMAVLEKFPQAKLGIGPVIENGFYYDFDLPEKISETDLPKLEKHIKRLISQNLSFRQLNKTPAEARNLLGRQKFKLELVTELEKAKKPITFYESGQFLDLCSGPHVISTKEIPADGFRLTHLAGAYWRGSEKNKMLTRIYGVAFENKKILGAYLAQQAEAKKRDHRILGQNLDLFAFSELVGKGLPLLTPKGSVIRRELERFIVDEEVKRGYQHVFTPPLAKTELYKTSGHYPYYKDTMYPPMRVDEEELILRPMTCPHHFMLFASRPRSYKELPLRYAEISPQFRYEKSGELTGLMRVRMFTLVDAHIFCTADQVEKEIENVLRFIDSSNKILGLKKGLDYRYRLSLGDRQDQKKYYKDDRAWEYAENVLRKILKKTKAPFYEAPAEAAFYGPKIDVQVKKINGQEETAFTVQYDFVMPKRFNLRYIDNRGKEREPIVIHRASIGCLERTIAFLIEHYAGAFPLWLSPVQVAIIPVGKAHKSFAKKLFQEFLRSQIRVELYGDNETVGYKIRAAEKQKVPYILVIGEKEKNTGKLMIRIRGKKALKVMAKLEFLKDLIERIKMKK